MFMVFYPRRSPFFSYGTLGLVTLNLCAFLGEIHLGGSENLEVLQILGALDPLAIAQQGEWWRVLTANFLHYGLLHLGVNGLGLGVFGPLLEKPLGLGRFLMLYLVSGTGAMALMTLYLWATEDYQRLVVGASAAIMGLVGGLGILYFRQWQEYPSPWTQRRLGLFSLLVGFQFVLDFHLPDVSVMSHGFGFGLGLGLMVFLDPTGAAH